MKLIEYNELHGIKEESHFTDYGIFIGIGLFVPLFVILFDLLISDVSHVFAIVGVLLGALFGIIWGNWLDVHFSKVRNIKRSQKKR
jgi:hypothetical protein